MSVSIKIKLIKKIQVLIVSSIQQVYESQGVSISDKHIELIVRQMSSKVQIAKPGKTSLKSGEIIDLENIQYLNTSMDYFNESLATYIPILYGITRASLKTDSFISAASFQETTKVVLRITVIYSQQRALAIEHDRSTFKGYEPDQ